MQITVDEHNTSEPAVEKYERLKLDKDEWARVMIPDVTAAQMEWVHTMRAPQVEDGVVLMVEKTRFNKTKYQDYDTDFVGQRICFGDPNWIKGEGRGLDERHCPACKAAADGVPDMAPERAYAVPVITYDLRSKSAPDVRNPAGAKILVWRLTSRLWDRLCGQARGIRELLDLPPDAEVKLSSADIVIADDGGYGKIRFEAPMRPAWRRDPELKKLVIGLWANKENRPTEAQLLQAIGRGGDRSYMDLDVKTVVDAWAEVHRIESGAKPAARTATAAAQPGSTDGEDLAAGLEDLDDLDALTRDDTAAVSPGADGGDLSGLEEFMTEGAEETARPAKANGTKPAAKAAKPAAAKAAEPDSDVDAMLADDAVAGSAEPAAADAADDEDFDAIMNAAG